METLACMSARTCPACWRFTGGQCALMAPLQAAVGATRIPIFTGPLPGLAPA